MSKLLMEMNKLAGMASSTGTLSTDRDACRLLLLVLLMISKKSKVRNLMV